MLAAKEDGVGLITFNQPEKRNAMSVEMWGGLGEILDEFARGQRGPRGRADRCRATRRSSPARISASSRRSAAMPTRSANTIGAQCRARASWRAFPKPVIARIRGFCLGGGLAIAMQADLRIAAAKPVRHSGGAARHRLWLRRG